MATSNNRRRTSLVPEVPAYDPAASERPTSPLRYRGRGSALDRLGEAIRRTPGEVASYARDVVRNPMRELDTAAAPLIGAAGGVATGLRSIPSRSALAQSQAQAGQVLRNARPSFGQLMGGGAGTVATAGAAGVALGAEDAAHKEQQAAATPDPDFSSVTSGVLPPRRVTRPQDVGNNQVVSADGSAHQVDPREMLQRVSASPNQRADARDSTGYAVRGIDNAAVDTRSRITSAMLNPMSNDAELVRRLNNSQRSYMNRGSPQARRLAAQPYLDALSSGNEASLQGLRGMTHAYGQGANNEVGANQDYARRSDVASMFNTRAGENRRESDRSYELDVAKLGLQGQQAADARQAEITRRYDDAYKFNIQHLGMTPEQARAAVREQESREGLVAPGGSPVGRHAALAESEGIERDFTGPDGLRGWADGLWDRIQGLERGDPTKSGSTTFNPDDWESGGQSFLQRLGSRMRPGVAARDPIYTHRRTGQQRFMPGYDGRKHERRATERDPGRRLRRDED